MAVRVPDLVALVQNNIIPPHRQQVLGVDPHTNVRGDDHVTGPEHRVHQLFSARVCGQGRCVDVIIIVVREVLGAFAGHSRADRVQNDHPKSGPPPVKLLAPLAQNSSRTHNQHWFGEFAAVVESCKERNHLDGFSESHLVANDSPCLLRVQLP
ncbi:hypothetical protein OGAPHI_007150 [Ogataea philodendri]|uniref:Uncharacterized protein n=1 Tax=Ogataea philodendri TaxID=1378263 RepID=A0A9P8NW73_9ASCO|nr:uncharacterized protein OGAPHI_007150 [Ogataea philodendri]KAH3660564.1 hypothetical protein OGAPHI_007150 [Ogataea philodendri]